MTTSPITDNQIQFLERYTPYLRDQVLNNSNLPQTGVFYSLSEVYDKYKDLKIVWWKETHKFTPISLYSEFNFEDSEGFYYCLRYSGGGISISKTDSLDKINVSSLRFLCLSFPIGKDVLHGLSFHDICKMFNWTVDENFITEAEILG
jgi:hypothetical protein